MQIATAIIARPQSATLAACLAALREAGAAPTVFEIGADGTGMARNRALAACPVEVLALVEDDVLVTAGWLDALHQAWGRAAPDLAVVGGPVRPRFAGRRPEWLGSGLDGAFAMLDLGPEALVVDPAARTFHGANVSFRAAALRGVAGFWPARGHPDGRDWFSEEHHAQHALAAQGWRGRYEPAAAVERIVEPPGKALVLRRRWRYGARLAVAGGGRPASVAARAVARGAAGALRSRDAATRLESAGRLAENVGVLTGRRLARRDLEPVARTTPFRPSVPTAEPRRRPHAQRGALVLLYHRVVDATDDPLGLCVSPRYFADQIDVLSSCGRIVALEELVAQPEPGSVALTFDDGYQDNASIVAPLLAARQLPWTLFVSTGHVERGARYWWDEVVALLGAEGRSAQLELELPGGRRAWRVDTRARREEARNRLLAALQGLDPTSIDRALDAVRAWAHGDADQAEAVAMSVDELQTVARAGVAVGAHTRTHRGLAYASQTDQHDEVVRSRDDLARWLGQPPMMFAYPFGAPGADVDATTQAVVRGAGFRAAVLNAPGVVTPRTDPFAVPRHAVADLDADRFRAWLGHLAG
jgi:peptidoglycan/xylan/chitin deacetylase (PgdA/CDA1 family)